MSPLVWIEFRLVPQEAICPHCGGRQIRQITPSQFECVTPLPTGLAPPEASPTPPMRPCGHLFHIPTAARTAPCSCGRESIGKCIGCERPLCGLHGTGEAEFLCESCRESRVTQKRMRAEEAARDHELGLVDVGGSLGPPGQGGRLPLRDVWITVSAAVGAKDPPADIMVLDDLRLEELPSRWPQPRGWKRKQDRILAEWNAVVDRLAVPAWDTGATLRSGSGVADTFSVDEHPLYLGSNDVLYCNPARPTPNGTYAEWKASYQSTDDVPGVWSSKWAYSTPFYPRQEVAEALANLVAVHSVHPDI